MTDKQIIIDGVDVSGCKHYNHNDKNSGWSGCTSKDEEHIHSANPLCCEKKDCLYKLYKRKEQECEELKRYKSLFEKARDLWNEASKTNYKLLDEIEDLKDSLKRTICQSECYKHKEAEKLKQTLADIKPIVEFYSNSKLGVEQPNGTYSMEIKDDKVIGGTYNITYNPNPAKTALDKINEVI